MPNMRKIKGFYETAVDTLLDAIDENSWRKHETAMKLTEREIEILKRVDSAGGKIHAKMYRDIHPFSITGLAGKGMLVQLGVVSVGEHQMALYQITDAGKAAIK